MGGSVGRRVLAQKPGRDRAWDWGVPTRDVTYWATGEGVGDWEREGSRGTGGGGDGEREGWGEGLPRRKPADHPLSYRRTKGLP